ncbi:MAG: Kazal-type serine protease inhibitor domain protein [Myxococcaceae bacterium]|nr:Kazal-type serine protease inhibitor domain protein [Myxococcaceae bacterium]
MKFSRTFLAYALCTVGLPLALSSGGCSSDSGGNGNEIDPSSEGDAATSNSLDGSTPGKSTLDGSNTKPPTTHADASVSADGALLGGDPGLDSGGADGSDAGARGEDAGHKGGDAGHLLAGDGGVGQHCGARSGVTCADGEYCLYATADQCGAADATGVCTRITKICEQSCLAERYCGCDGHNYCNACQAGQAGTSVAHVGQCTETPPPDGAGKGQTCLGIAGIQCAAGLFCKIVPDQCRPNVSDAAGTCETQPTVCPLAANKKAVCSCDNMTYASECDAWLAGASVMQTGACK